MLARDATTLWEHWNYSANTFSHNHPMFGSVSQWFYNWLGGIEPDQDAVGFDKITLQPQFLSGVDWVRCTHRSIRGPITCNWQRQGDRVRLELCIPANANATLVLPAAGRLSAAGGEAADADGVERMAPRNGHAAFRLASGRYVFVFAPSN